MHGQRVEINRYRARASGGTDALIECTMTDSAGKTVSRCLMTVATSTRRRTRAADWPPDLIALFFEKNT